MLKKTNDIDKFINRKLNDLKAKAPDDIWNNIQAGLHKDKRRTLFFYWPWAAAIAVLLFVSLIWLIPVHFEENLNLAENLNKTIPHEKLNNKTINKTAEQISQSKSTSENNDISDAVNSTKKLKQKENKAKAYTNNPSNLKIVESRKSDHLVDQNTLSATSIVDLPGIKEGSNLLHLPQKKAVNICSNINDQLLKLQTREIDHDFDQVIANNILKKEKNEQEKNKTRIQLQGSMSPLYSFRNSVQNSSDPYYNLGGGPENSNAEEALMAYSGGVTVGLKKNRLQLSTGMFYLQEGQVVSNFYINKVVSGPQNSTIFAATSLGNLRIDQNNSRIDGKLPEDIPPDDLLSPKAIPTGARLYQQFEFIEIPLIASYALVNKKLNISVSGGLSTNVLVGNLIVFKYENDKYELGPVENVNTMNYNSLMGFELSYPFSKKIRFRLQPLFRYALNPLNKSYSVSYIPYSFAIYTGINYEF